jgi:hypothetical protein
MAASEYEQLINTKTRQVRRTRTSVYTEEERTEKRRASARLAMESRRRATAVLIARYRAEYDELYTTERESLLGSGNPKYTGELKKD